jgi:flagellar basal body-associated protein FliL
MGTKTRQLLTLLSGCTEREQLLCEIVQSRIRQSPEYEKIRCALLEYVFLSPTGQQVEQRIKEVIGLECCTVEEMYKKEEEVKDICRHFEMLCRSSQEQLENQSYHIDIISNEALRQLASAKDAFSKSASIILNSRNKTPLQALRQYVKYHYHPEIAQQYAQLRSEEYISKDYEHSTRISRGSAVIGAFIGFLLSLILPPESMERFSTFIVQLLGGTVSVLQFVIYAIIVILGLGLFFSGEGALPGCLILLFGISFTGWLFSWIKDKVLILQEDTNLLITGTLVNILLFSLFVFFTSVRWNGFYVFSRFGTPAQGMRGWFGRYSILIILLLSITISSLWIGALVFPFTSSKEVMKQEAPMLQEGKSSTTNTTATPPASSAIPVTVEKSASNVNKKEEEERKLEIKEEEKGSPPVTRQVNVQVVVTRANIRSAPSLQASVMTLADQDEILPSFEQQQDKKGEWWYHVERYDGTLGWINGQTVTEYEGDVEREQAIEDEKPEIEEWQTETNASSLYESERAPMKFVTVMTPQVNVRVDPNINAVVLTRADRNDELPVYEERTDLTGLVWYLVDTKDGYRGWVSSKTVR